MPCSVVHTPNQITEPVTKYRKFNVISLQQRCQFFAFEITAFLMSHDVCHVDSSRDVTSRGYYKSNRQLFHTGLQNSFLLVQGPVLCGGTNPLQPPASLEC